jgi:hypothetical protein
MGKTIAQCRKESVLPADGTPVVTNPTIDDCRGFLVKQKHIDARKAAPGIYKGWVPGAGGDIWWVQHEDGSVGAYVFTEVSDPPGVKEERPRFRKYRA